MSGYLRSLWAGTATSGSGAGTLSGPDPGGYYAATFCSHWYHRVPLFIAIDLVSTLALVTLIG